MRAILIIEDDVRIASALAIRLKNHGYSVMLAHDALQGASLAVSCPPDLIVLDIGLPAGDGLELAARLRERPETQHTPVIFLTASKDPRLRTRVMEFQAAGLLEKPYDGEDLVATVRFVLGETSTITVAAARVGPGALRGALRKKILIIDDDPQIAMALGLRLQQAGFEPASASDALTGVQAALKFQPDLVVLDIHMPAGDCFSTAERIRKLISAPLPIIFITGLKEPGLRARAERLGAAGFFEKPFDSRHLLDTVQHSLGPTRTGTSPATEPQVVRAA